jgi:hypothetical protein
MTPRGIWENITITCDICGTPRDPEDIDVHSTRRIVKGVKVIHNVRFCATRDECRAKAKTFDHFETEATE